MECVKSSDQSKKIEMNDSENVIAEFFAKAKQNKRRSSFFGFDPAVPEPSDEKELEEAYFKKLEKEHTDWVDILRNYNDKARDFWRDERTAVVDKSILSKERQEFIAKAIDMQQYLKESEQFNKRVDLYVEQKKWLDMRYKNLLELAEEELTEKFYEEQL